MFVIVVDFVICSTFVTKSKYYYRTQRLHAHLGTEFSPDLGTDFGPDLGPHFGHEFCTHFGPDFGANLAPDLGPDSDLSTDYGKVENQTAFSRR